MKMIYLLIITVMTVFGSMSAYAAVLGDNGYQNTQTEQTATAACATCHETNTNKTTGMHVKAIDPGESTDLVNLGRTITVTAVDGCASGPLLWHQIDPDITKKLTGIEQYGI